MHNILSTVFESFVEFLSRDQVFCFHAPALGFRDYTMSFYQFHPQV